MDTPSKKQILRYAQDDNYNSGVFMKHALDFCDKMAAEAAANGLTQEKLEELLN